MILTGKKRKNCLLTALPALQCRDAFQWLDKAFPAIESIASDVVKEVVKYPAPVVFGPETARYLEKFFTEYGLPGGRVVDDNPHRAGLAV